MQKHCLDMIDFLGNLVKMLDELLYRIRGITLKNLEELLFRLLEESL